MKTLILFCSSIFFISYCHCAYYSQCGQDKFVYENFFSDLQEGFFVDIGAHDGITLSNSYFFESEKGWKGLCVEPMPNIFAKLQANRKAKCVQGCVSNKKGFVDFLCVSPGFTCESIDMLSGIVDKLDPRHVERINHSIASIGGSSEVISVECFLLNDLLDEMGVNQVDFLSVDTEGGEFEILEAIDFARFKINVIAVEDNYGDSRFLPFLESRGYKFIQRLDQDLLFVREDFVPKLSWKGKLNKRKDERRKKRREILNQV